MNDYIAVSVDHLLIPIHICPILLNMENIYPSSNQKNRSELAASISLCALLGFVIIYITASYFRLSSMEHLLSFVGNDLPEGYADSIAPRPWGEHYFGDYLLPRWQSALDNPWINSDSNTGPINNYLPFAMFLFRVLSLAPYWTSFVILTSASTALLLVVIFRQQSQTNFFSRIQFLISGVLLTAPFLSLIDRGNIQLLLTSICCLSVACYLSDNKSCGAFILGLAIGLKGYPIVFLILWIKERRWRDVGIAIVTASVTTIAPLIFIFQGGVFANLKRVTQNINEWGNIYTQSAPAYNNSMKGFFIALENLDIPFLSYFIRIASDNFRFLIIIFLATALLAMLNTKATTFEVVLIAISMVTISVDFVGMYALGLYYLVFIVIGDGAQLINQTLRRIIFVMIGILMMPKTIPLRFWRDELNGLSTTYAPILSGLATLTIFLVVICGIFQRTESGKIRADRTPLLKYSFTGRFSARGGVVFHEIVDGMSQDIVDTSPTGGFHGSCPLSRRRRRY